MSREKKRSRDLKTCLLSRGRGTVSGGPAGVLVSGKGHWRPCGTTLCSLKLSGRAVFTAGVLQLASVVPEPFV